jgi:hypothetical protein
MHGHNTATLSTASSRSQLLPLRQFNVKQLEPTNDVPPLKVRFAPVRFLAYVAPSTFGAVNLTANLLEIGMLDGAAQSTCLSSAVVHWSTRCRFASL